MRIFGDEEDLFDRKAVGVFEFERFFAGDLFLRTFFLRVP